jgi:hypothetical protein
MWWSLAGNLLSKCDTLIVFGFSFNEYDQAIRQFFQKKLSRNANVLLVDAIDHRRRLKPVFATRSVTYLSAKEANLNKTLLSLLK